MINYYSIIKVAASHYALKHLIISYYFTFYSSLDFFFVAKNIP